jgi:hypothetical protein
MTRLFFRVTLAPLPPALRAPQEPRHAPPLSCPEQTATCPLTGLPASGRGTLAMGRGGLRN